MVTRAYSTLSTLMADAPATSLPAAICLQQLPPGLRVINGPAPDGLAAASVSSLCAKLISNLCNCVLSSRLACKSCCNVAFILLSLVASSSSRISTRRPRRSLRLDLPNCPGHADSRLGERQCWQAPLASCSSLVPREIAPPQHCFRVSSSMFWRMWESSRVMKSLSQWERSAARHGVTGDTPYVWEKSGYPLNQCGHLHTK